MVKRFEIKQEVKILAQLNKILSEERDILTEEEILRRDYFVTDPTQVLGIMGKTKEGKLILRRFIDGENIKEEPTLNYEDNLKDGLGVLISCEYLNHAVNILNVSGESIKITSVKDFPITLENEHFKIVIAPRVGQD